MCPKRDLNYWRIAYDNLFNLIILCVIVVMVSGKLASSFPGLIYDSYSQIREEDENTRLDQRNVCFICGNDRNTINKVTTGENGFFRHIQTEHNEFHYMYFISYLKDKNPHDLTCMEQYVLNCIERGDHN